MVLVRDKGRDILDNGQGVAGLLLTGRAFSLKNGDKVRVRQSKFVTKLVRLSKKSFCEILDSKMGAEGNTYWYFPAPTRAWPICSMGTSTSAASLNAHRKWFLR